MGLWHVGCRGLPTHKVPGIRQTGVLGESGKTHGSNTLEKCGVLCVRNPLTEPHIPEPLSGFEHNPPKLIRFTGASESRLTSNPLIMRVPFFLIFGVNKRPPNKKGQKGTTGKPRNP